MTRAPCPLATLVLALLLAVPRPARADDLVCEVPAGDPAVACDPPPDPVPGPFGGACTDRGRHCNYTLVRGKALELGDLTFSYPAVGYDFGRDRDVDVRVRIPKTARNDPTPLPVVLIMHGGGTGAENGQTKLEEWGETIARAGYATINLGHPGRTTDEWEALCATLNLSTIDPPGQEIPGGPEGSCGRFKYLSHDRPHDVAEIIDHLADIESAFGIALDENAIAVAGHSAGAGAAMVVGGAGRQIGDAGEVVYFADARPVAFIALSPQGPGTDGFTDTSWNLMQALPFLVATGTGDIGSDECPYLRRAPHHRMMSEPDATRYLLFVCDATIAHTNFSLEQPGPRKFESTLKTVVIAFLDAYLKGSAVARAWIDSQNVVAKAKGTVEWSVLTQ